MRKAIGVHALTVPLAICALAPALAQEPELPSKHVAWMEGAAAIDFEGKWSVIKPGATTTALTCHIPTVITASGAAQLTYEGVGGPTHEFSLREDAALGQTLWDGGEPQRAVWTDVDSFVLYPLFDDGSLDTEYATLYERCADYPTSNSGDQIPGAVAPFVGSWSEYLSAKRGGGAEELQASCDDPTSFSVHDDAALLQTIAGMDDLVVPVGAENGRTIFDFEDLKQVVVWVTPDRWLMYGPGLDGRTDFNLPFIFARCEES